MSKLVVLAVALFVFGGTVALAEPPKAPEEVAEADLLRVQLAEANAREAQTRAEALQLLASLERDKLRAKYKLGEADAIDPQTRVIRRAPKPTKATAK